MIFLLLCTLLASCGGESSEDTKGLSTKVTETFSLSVPTTWEILSSKSDKIPQPVSGTIVLAASSPDIKSWFSNSLTVLEESLEQEVSLSAFSENLKTSLQKDMNSYIEKETLPFTFLDGTESELRVFQARYNANTPLLLYFQVPQICGENIYITTLALDNSITDFEKYKYILSTFTCKSQK